MGPFSVWPGASPWLVALRNKYSASKPSTYCKWYYMALNEQKRQWQTCHAEQRREQARRRRLRQCIVFKPRKAEQGRVRKKRKRLRRQLRQADWEKPTTCGWRWYLCPTPNITDGGENLTADDPRKQTRETVSKEWRKRQEKGTNQRETTQEKRTKQRETSVVDGNEGIKKQRARKRQEDPAWFDQKLEKESTTLVRVWYDSGTTNSDNAVI